METSGGMFSPLDLARAQFAFTVSFHIVPPGLAIRTVLL
jgi:cytochrome bd-type quinol oxidase subunit 1